MARSSIGVRLGFALALFCGPGCPSPAAPPSPPAELPTLRVPDPRIDVSKIATDTGSPSRSAFVAPGGEFSTRIAYGADVIGFANQALEELLFPLRQVEIPANAQTTNLEARVILDEGTPAEFVLDFKFDFADFDFDGDGRSEGCSGHTGDLPICVRIWVEGPEDPVRLGGVFTAFPTETNPGAGSLKVEGLLDLKVGLVFDHQDPTAKSTEIFTRTIVDFSRPAGERGALFENHALVTQTGSEASAIKQVNLNQGFDTSGNATGQTGSVRYLGQFREDADFWSGRIEAVSSESAGLSSGELPVTCARVSTGGASDPGNCQDLDIDVTGLEFIDFLTAADVDLPAAFPSEPTF